MASIKLPKDQAPCSVIIKGDETAGTVKVQINLTPYQLDDSLVIAPQQPQTGAAPSTCLQTGLEQPASIKPNKVVQAVQETLQQNIAKMQRVCNDLDLQLAQTKANLISSSKTPSTLQQIGASIKDAAKPYLSRSAQGYSPVDNSEITQPLLQETRLDSASPSTDPQAAISPLPVSSQPVAAESSTALENAAPAKPSLMQKLRNLGTRVGNFLSMLYANCMLAFKKDPAKAAPTALPTPAEMAEKTSPSISA